MYLAIDLGGTNIKLSLFGQENAHSLWQKSIPAYAEKGIAQALNRVVMEVVQAGMSVLDGQNRMDCPSDISADFVSDRQTDVQTGILADIGITKVGIAIPGIVDTKSCRLRSVNDKYADAIDFLFADWCESTFHCPLVMENDANAALLGETYSGCGAGSSNAVMMILGTGIGTAAMVEGNILHGCHGQAGILGGHFVIQSNGKACSCGSQGCLEAYCGAKEVAASLENMDRRGSLLESFSKPTMKELSECWRAKDGLATELMEKQIRRYADGIVNLIHAYDPEIVILSGGVMNAGEPLLQAIREQVWRRAWTPWGRVEFRVAVSPDYSVTAGLYAMMRSRDA